MKNITLQVVICAFICFIAWHIFAESVACVDRSAITTLLTNGNAIKLEGIVTRLERDWDRTKDPAYFESMNAICQEVATQTVQNTKWLPNLLRYSNLLLDKSEEVKNSDRCIMYANEISVNHRLLELLTDNTLRADSSWPQNRLNIVRLVAVFYHTVQERYIPNFEPYDVVFNVMPPVGSGIDAGGSPASIKDAKARADYEVAIQDNARKTALNREQHFLADIVQNELPKCEAAIVEAYSQEPLNYEELSELLQVGGFSPQTRYHIILSVVKTTGKAAPVGILPLLPKEPQGQK